MTELLHKIGDNRLWRREQVIVVAEADIAGKVVVQRINGGAYGLAHKFDLELLPVARFHAWWKKDILMVRRAENSGEYTTLALPKEILPMLRRVMFSKKAAVQDSMRPDNLGEDIE